MASLAEQIQFDVDRVVDGLGLRHTEAEHFRAGVLENGTIEPLTLPGAYFVALQKAVEIEVLQVLRRANLSIRAVAYRTPLPLTPILDHKHPRSSVMGEMFPDNSRHIGFSVMSEQGIKRVLRDEQSGSAERHLLHLVRTALERTHGGDEDSLSFHIDKDDASSYMAVDGRAHVIPSLGFQARQGIEHTDRGRVVFGQEAVDMYARASELHRENLAAERGSPRIQSIMQHPL